MTRNKFLLCITVCIIIPRIQGLQKEAEMNFQSLHVKMESMDTKIAVLQRKDTEHHTKIQQLQTTIADQQNTITKLEKENNDHTNLLKYQQNEITKLNDINVHYGNTIDDIQQAISEQITDIANLTETVNYQNILLKSQTIRMTSLERNCNLAIYSAPGENLNTITKPVSQVSTDSRRLSSSDNVDTIIGNKMSDKVQATHEQKKSYQQKTKVQDSKTGQVKQPYPVKQKGQEQQIEIAEQRDQVIQTDPREHTDQVLQKDKRLVLAVENPVAFTVSVSKITNNIGIDQNIHFDNVQLNLGYSYHKFQGNFIVPQNGIYLIASSVMFDNRVSTGVFAVIVHNNNEVATLYGQGHDGGWTQGSQTVIIQAKQGDEIWVRNKNYINTSVYNQHTCTFSGILLIPM